MKLLVAYDGARFSGFAKNFGIRSVAGDLESALARILRHDVVVTGAGRTDKGVHAWGQVVTFDTSKDRFFPDRLVRSLNGLCGPELIVREASAVPVDFDARFSARWRRYRYVVNNGPTLSPFTARYSWHVPDVLSLDHMNLAAQAFIGTHDFTSFCRRPPVAEGRPEMSLSRSVLGATWTEVSDGRLRFEITATAFCHQMVRSIVGTLIDVGRGHRGPAEVPRILEARDRAVAGNLAPPQGLFLWEVGY